MRIKLKNAQDLARYVSSLNVDEGIRITYEDIILLITRYDMKYYLEIRSQKSTDKIIFEKIEEIINYVSKILVFPITAEIY
ncbi:MAG: hypothetical protein RQ952_02020 [Thermoproteota archaeon]|jgi:ABC-type uncharacterized transport system substrate-binding protein|nr:hypothetical protein [Thermoproteota archaeon]